jgi:hypothetical protein
MNFNDKPPLHFISHLDTTNFLVFKSAVLLNIKHGFSFHAKQNSLNAILSTCNAHTATFSQITARISEMADTVIANEVNHKSVLNKIYSIHK